MKLPILDPVITQSDLTAAYDRLRLSNSKGDRVFAEAIRDWCALQHIDICNDVEELNADPESFETRRHCMAKLVGR